MYISNTIITKVAGWSAVALVVGAAYMLASNYFTQKRLDDGITQSHSITDTSYSKDFVGVCSGIDMTNPEVHLIAVSECMGRVRGFVDGHDLTVAMIQMASGNKRSNALWCMPTNVTSDQLLSDVMDWADRNPSAYVEVRSKMDDNNSATAVMIRALRETYPCANS